MEQDSTKALDKVIRIDEREVRDHLTKPVRGTVEETLNALLDEGGASCKPRPDVPGAALRAFSGDDRHVCRALLAQAAHLGRGSRVEGAGAAPPDIRDGDH